MARPIRTVRRRRRRSTPRAGATGLLTAAVLGGALASVGMVATGIGTSGPALTPAALVSPVPPAPAAAPRNAPPRPAPAAPGQAGEDAALVSEPKAVAFLGAMRAAEVPTSRNGLAEVLTAKAACAELASGTTEADLARRIPKGLPTVTRKQAATLVNLAQKHYC